MYQNGGLRPSKEPQKNSLQELMANVGKDVNTLSNEFEQSSSTSTAPQSEQKNPAETEGDTKINITSYFLNTSQVAFPNDAEELGLALFEAEQGNLQRLTEIKTRFAQGLEEFKKIPPPPEVTQIHEGNIKVVEGYIALIDSAAKKTRGTVQGTWDSPELEELTQKSKEVNAETLRIIEQYNIELPPGVLSE